MNFFHKKPRKIAKNLSKKEVFAIFLRILFMSEIFKGGEKRDTA